MGFISSIISSNTPECAISVLGSSVMADSLGMVRFNIVALLTGKGDVSVMLRDAGVNLYDCIG